MSGKAPGAKPDLGKPAEKEPQAEAFNQALSYLMRRFQEFGIHDQSTMAEPITATAARPAIAAVAPLDPAAQATATLVALATQSAPATAPPAPTTLPAPVVLLVQ